MGKWGRLSDKRERDGGGKTALPLFHTLNLPYPPHLWGQAVTTFERCGLSLSFINTGLALVGGCWNREQQLKTSLMYWSSVWFPRMEIKSNLQPPLLSLHRKGQLAACSLVHTPYFSVSKLIHSSVLHRAETGSHPTNGEWLLFNSTQQFFSYIMARTSQFSMRWCSPPCTRPTRWVGFL